MRFATASVPELGSAAKYVPLKLNPAMAAIEEESEGLTRPGEGGGGAWRNL